MAQRNEIAVLLAAGKGTRLFPLTEDTPKPLIQVQGKPLIETLIEAFQYRGIKKIYVIIGFKGEQFKYLEDKYENLQLIENTQYQTTNNCSSIMALLNTVGEINEDYFICDSDSYINHPDIFLPAFNQSVCWCKYTAGVFDEWYWPLDGDRVTDFVKGGENGYTVCNIVYLRHGDAHRVFERLKTEFAKPENSNLYWEQVLAMCLTEFKMGIYPVDPEDIIEVDTVKDFDALNLYLTEK